MLKNKIMCEADFHRTYLGTGSCYGQLIISYIFHMGYFTEEKMVGFLKQQSFTFLCADFFWLLIPDIYTSDKEIIN